MAVLALLPMAPAHAHGGLQSADPMPREQLEASPRQIRLQFAMPTVPDARTRIDVITPSGENLAVGAPQATGLGVGQQLSATTESGKYRVAFAVVSVDGHVTTGGYTFWVDLSRQPATDAATPAWWLGLIGLLIAFTAGAAVMSNRRSMRPVE
jgi:methionine-rich copper-binding protein CopC